MTTKNIGLYHWQLWLVLRVQLLEINSELLSSHEHYEAFCWRNWDDVFLKSDMGRQHLVEMIRDHKMAERTIHIFNIHIFGFAIKSEVYPNGTFLTIYKFLI